MKPFVYAFAAVVLSWLAAPASAECNRQEYGAIDSWIASCVSLGVAVDPGMMVCPDDKLATAKANLDWVSEDKEALEAYRSSVKEQVACGFPQMPLTYLHAAMVAVKPHDPLAQCLMLLCNQKLGLYMMDLQDQGKLPTE